MRTRRTAFLLAVMILIVVGGVALAQSTPETGVEFLGGRLGWNELMLGMTQKQVEDRLGAPIELSSQMTPSGGCGLVATTHYKGQQVTVRFRQVHRDHELSLLFFPFPEERSLEPIVTFLKNRIPELRYRPSRHAADLMGTANTKPLYVLEEDETQGVMIGPKEGLWITHITCLD